MNDESYITVDACGLLCPHPVLRLQKALRGVARGARVRLLTSDALSKIDVPHFCTQAQHKVITHAQEPEGFGTMTLYSFIIEKSGEGER